MPQVVDEQTDKQSLVHIFAIAKNHHTKLFGDLRIRLQCAQCFISFPEAGNKFLAIEDRLYCGTCVKKMLGAGDV